MSARDIIIDCDPGVDDAVALFLAFSAPETLNVRAVTTVAGNVPLHMTQKNARRICDLAGRQDIPVYAGCPAPYLRDAVSAEEFHGADGLEGIPAFEPETPLQDQHGVSFLIETLRIATDPMTLVITGPMTNAAMAIRQAPDILDTIDQIILMGGADTEGGNITPHAEYNIFADPHAANIVFNCGAKIVALSLDITHKLRTTDARIADIRSIGSPNAEHIANLLQATNDFERKMRNWGDGPLHDPSTIAYLLAPSLFNGKSVSISVQTEDGDKQGKTVLTESTDGPVTWLTEADDTAVYQLLNERFANI